MHSGPRPGRQGRRVRLQVSAGVVPDPVAVAVAVAVVVVVVAVAEHVLRLSYSGVLMCAEVGSRPTSLLERGPQALAK